MLPSEYLEKGWCQGGLSGGLDRYCFVGAIRMWASSNCNLINDASREFSEIARMMVFGEEHSSTFRTSSVVWWNDMPERTKEEVVALAQDIEEQLGLREDSWTLPEIAVLTLSS